MKRLSFLSILILYGYITSAQDQKFIDSLHQELRTLQEAKRTSGKALDLSDTTMWSVLSELWGAYYKHNEDSTLAYVNKSVALAQEIGHKKGIGEGFNLLGILHMRKSDYLQALDYYKKAAEFCEESNNQLLLAMVLANTGVVHIRRGDYAQALKYQLQSLKINEDIGQQKGIANAHLSIGAIHMSLADTAQALKHYLIALEIWESTNYMPGIARVQNNLGEIYAAQGKFAEALMHFDSSMQIKSELRDTFTLVSTLLNIGNLHIQQDKHQEALNTFASAFRLAELIEDRDGMAAAYLNMGIAATQNQQYAQAASYLRNGLELAKEIGSLDYVKEGYASLAALDSINGNDKGSLNYYKLFIATRDSIFNLENSNEILESQFEYEYEKKAAVAQAEQAAKEQLAQKELQKQKLMRNGFMGGFAIVLLFAGVFFVQRNKIKSAKLRSDELLLNILPSEVAEELKRKGSADTQLIDSVTVLFSDIKSFTEFSERVSPTELVSEINTCFSAFDLIMGKYRIEKIKTIGDTYMAAGGLPTPNYTHPADVVNAALELQQFIKEHNVQRIASGKPYFDIRIGVHTGPVVAGIVGIKKFQYDIWGDTVNTASRMETFGEEGKVNISESTYALVKEHFTCTSRGPIEVKGKGMVDMYFVEGRV